MDEYSIYNYVNEFFSEIVYRDDKFIPISLFTITDIFNNWFEYTYNNYYMINDQKMFRYLRKYYWQDMLKIDNEIFLFNHDFAINNFT